MRSRALISALAVAAIAVSARPAFGQTVPLLRETEAGIAVRTRHFDALISPGNGGRMTSFRFGGVEMTRVSPDGHGGLFEERWTADFPFSVIELVRTEAEASVTLSADADGLRVVKEYMFRTGQPWFAVRTTFENRSPYPRAGSDGPGITNVVLPAGARAETNGQLCCLNRGAGAEVLTERVFLTSPGQPDGGTLRWFAVADPASRRSVGFALQGCGVSPLPPRRTSDGALAFGWSYPPIPPGQRLSTEVRVVPCEVFSAIAELNGSFVVETLPAVAPGPLPVRFDIMSLGEPLAAVSVITRAYAADGRELAPCDPVLFSRLEPGRPERAEIRRADDGEEPAVLLHEVYSQGRIVGAFHVPLETGALPGEPVPPRPAPKPEQIVPAPISGPGAGIPITEGARRKGFLVWMLDGPAATESVEEIEVCLGEDERYTAFLGVRALRDIGRLRFTVAGAAGGAGHAADAVPPGVLSLWRIEEGSRSAFMVPAGDLQMTAGQVVWLALSLDAGALKPRTYTARIVADSDGVLWQMPVTIRVVRADPLQTGPFGLWYSQPSAVGLDEQSLAKLREYGVSCLTVSESDARDEFVDAVEERGFDILARSRGLQGLPPRGEADGLMLLGEASPVWLLRAGVAPPRTALAAASRGYATALGCERAEAVAEEALATQHRHLALLVDGGCPMGAISDLCADDRLDGEESVWLHVDLRGMHWRRAAIELRSGMWAAGWQGLAGAVVTADVPAPEVDRHSVLWNVIRDARAEVARWRQTRERIRGLPANGPGGAEVVRARALVESTVGVGEGCELRLLPVRRPFRDLLRVIPAGGAQALSLRSFRSAHRTVLVAGAALPERVGSNGENWYWDGIPCTEDGTVLWAIAVGVGTAARERALALQAAIEQKTGRRVPASRALPRAGRRGPRLVWLVGGASPPEGWPPTVQEVAAGVPRDGLAKIKADGGMRIVVVGDEVDLERLTGTFRTRTRLYAPARHVR